MNNGRTRWISLAVAATLTALVVFLQFGWFTVVFNAPDPVAAAWRDWVQFHRTAQRIVSGQAGIIYPMDSSAPEFTDGFYFLYPPFVAWITLPLAGLSGLAAYMACVAAVVGVTLVATLAILGALRVGARSRMLAGLATAASAPWSAAVFLGHLSAGLLLAPAIALLAWSRRRPWIAGSGLALLLAKPNWGLPVLAFLLVGRRWRMVGGFMVGGCVLFLAGLIPGGGLWGDWIQTMLQYRVLVTDGTPPWKQATLFATIESLTGRSGSDPRVFLPWALCSILLLTATALAWIRPGSREDDFPRLLGVALLATLVANPYAYFYDVLLLVPIAIILWTQPDSYRDPGIRLGARAASVMTYIWMHLQFFVLRESGPSLAGLGLLVWLTLELSDLVKSTESRRWFDRQR